MHQSEGGGDLAHVSGTVSPSSLTALLLEYLLGSFLTIDFVFPLFELCPSASFGVYSACYHVVANGALFADHIYAVCFSSTFFF